VLVLLAGVGIAAALRPHVEGAVFAPLFGALAMAVWVGGRGPGVVALVLAVVLSRYFLLEPLHSFSVHPSDAVRFATFPVSAGFVVAIGGGLHREREREMRALQATEALRREVEALQNVTARLSTARDPASVTQAVLTSGLSAVGASCGAVLVYDPERELLLIEGAVGYPPGLLDHLTEIPLDAHVPVAVAAKTREPVVLPSLAEIEQRFPAMLDVFRSVGRAGAVLPLLSAGRLLGGAAPRHSGLDEHDLIDVAVETRSDHLRIDVRDGGHGFALPKPHRHGGYGLPMVQRLTRHFGISRTDTTHAWAEINLA
jgi:dienelactone hydrolase